MRKIVVFLTLALSTFCCVSVHAQGKAPWTMTYHWITPSGENSEGFDVDAWIFGKKKAGHCEDEPKAVCHGGISIMKDDKVFAYVILNYAGKNAQGYIYNATYKKKGTSSATGKLVIRVKGNMETGPSIKIKALGELEGCPVDGLELMGTPTARLF